MIELVRAFLGPYQSQPAVLEFSAQQALQADSGPEREELSTLLEDLLQRRSPLRDMAVQRALESALDDLAETAERLESLYSLDEKEVEQARSEIASRRDWLDGRVQRTQRRVRSFVATLLKEQLLRRLENRRFTPYPHSPTRSDPLTIWPRPAVTFRDTSRPCGWSFYAAR